MQLKILGCSGGIAPGMGTTSFLINDDTLIDVGTGAESLTLEQMKQIKRVFITHSHLDHLCHLPFILNNLISFNLPPIEVYASAFTLDALKNHIFNNIIWPDFTKLPSKEAPCVVLKEIEVNQPSTFDEITYFPIEVNHAVPTLGFWVGKENQGYFAFSADSHSSPQFWKALNHLPEVKKLIIDNQYLDNEADISLLAKHFTPSVLQTDLQQLDYQTKIYITHLPPHNDEMVFSECVETLSSWQVEKLAPQSTFSF